MPNPNLSIRFTDEIYATRSDVIRILKTSLIDSIWANILNYRKQFSCPISFLDVTKMPYIINFTSGISEKLQSLDRRFSRIIVQYGKLADNSIEKYTIRNDMLMSTLRYVAQHCKIETNEIALNNIIEGKAVCSFYEPLEHYYSALQRLERRGLDPIDENLLAEYYAILSDQVGEMTSFYRVSEFASPEQKAVINREYVGVPCDAIESMMSNLLDFVNNSDLSFLVKAVVVFYAFDYIKPFEKFNEEMAMIVIKCIIAQTDVDRMSSIIPLEYLIAERRAEIDSINREVQKSRDMTYLVVEVCAAFDRAATNLLDRVATVNLAVAHNVYVAGSDPVEFKKEFGVEQETVMPLTKEEKVQEEPKSQPAYKPASEPVQPEKIVEKQSFVPQEEIKQVVRVQPGLSEKELSAAEEDLLESDPTLRPGQAHYFVRHCTVGKYYTIQQYKKSEGCVYETARTSMDNLARRGYYRRENVKNKFVYTPVKNR